MNVCLNNSNQIIGRISEPFSLFSIIYSVFDKNNVEIFVLKGSCCQIMLNCSCCLDVHIDIFLLKVTKKFFVPYHVE